VGLKKAARRIYYATKTEQRIRQGADMVNKIFVGTSLDGYISDRSNLDSNDSCFAWWMNFFVWQFH